MTIYAWLYMIPGLVSLFWPVMVLLVKKKPTRAQWLMAASCTVIGFSMILYSTYFNTNLQSEYFLNFLYTTISLFGAPLLYQYILCQTSLDGLSYRSRVVFAPSVVMTMIIIAVSIIGRAHGCRLFLSQAVHGGNTALTGPWSYNLMIIFGYYGFLITLALGVVYTAVLGSIKFIQYDKMVSEYYAANHMSRIQVGPWIFIYGVSVLLVAIILCIKPLHQLTNIPLLAVISVIQSVGMFLLGMYAYRQQYTAETLSHKLRELDLRYGVPQNDADFESRLTTVRDELTDYVERQQAYLNPDLSLVTLANHLHVSQRFLMRVLHEERGCSFAEYIDGLRISKAVGLLMVGAKNKGSAYLTSSIDDVEKAESFAHQCGYTSITAFYMAFNRVMGQSFESWLKEC